MSTIYDHPDVTGLIDRALHEDLRFGDDLTCVALVPPTAQLACVIRAKEPGVLCGLPLYPHIFAALGGGVVISRQEPDGTAVKPGDVVFTARGSARAILKAERTGLNFCQRLSGTASMARTYVDAVAGTRARILDTRKTTPGLRLLEKYAVTVGGAANHRIGLYDQVLIKENHIALMSGGAADSKPAEAVRRCRVVQGGQVVVEVEIEFLQDLAPCIRAGADMVLLDNMTPDQVREAVAIRDATPAPDGRRVLLEASGGITIATIRAYAEAGADRISVGALTHSVKALDLSMRCEPV